MEDAPPPPLVLANRVIQQMVDHSFGEGLVVEPQDFMVMRTAFRWNKGSWERAMHGSMPDIEILKNIVKAWGNMPRKKGAPSNA